MPALAINTRTNRKENPLTLSIVSYFEDFSFFLSILLRVFRMGSLALAVCGAGNLGVSGP